VPDRAAQSDPVAELRAALAGEAADRLDRVRAGAAIARVGGAVAIAAALGSLDGRAGADAFGWTVALVWIPLAGLVEAVRRRRLGVHADFASLVLDFGLLFALAAQFEEAVAIVVVAQVLVVAYYAYAGGRLVGVAAGAAAIVGAGGVAVAHDPTAVLPAFSLWLYPPTVLAGALFTAEVAQQRAAIAVGLNQMRDRAEAILTGVAESVVVTSPRGRIDKWNIAAERTFGCPAGAAVRRHCHDVLGLRRDLEQIDCSDGCGLLEARMAGDEDQKVWRTGPDGERQPLLAHVSPLFDERGQVVEVVHSFRDITNLMRADEAKTMFLATATHELKTPLTVILGFSELLLRQEDLKGDHRRTALQAINDRTRQLTGIVDRLLMTSRIESGKISLAPRAFDVVPLVRERCETLQAATGRIIVVETPPAVPDAHADLQGLATVLDHLLENAVKYSDPSMAVVVRVASDESRVSVAVSDEGIGMSAEDVAHCFDRFWQADIGDARRYGGTGIGLYIVKSLVEAMEGAVEVETAPGEGTTFVVSLWQAGRTPAPKTPSEGPEPSIIREFMRQVGVGGAT